MCTPITHRIHHASKEQERHPRYPLHYHGSSPHPIYLHILHELILILIHVFVLIRQMICITCYTLRTMSYSSGGEHLNFVFYHVHAFALVYLLACIDSHVIIHHIARKLH